MKALRAISKIENNRIYTRLKYVIEFMKRRTRADEKGPRGCPVSFSCLPSPYHLISCAEHFLQGVIILLTIIIIAELVFALIAFLFLVFINAPYGRYVRKGWGPAITARFGWMIMEFPAFFVIGYLVLTNLRKAGPFGMLFLIMWEAHYFYRVWVYPMILTSPDKPFPVLLVAFAICFNSLNGMANGMSLVDMGSFYTGAQWAADPRFWTGSALFITGFGIHTHSDKVLRLLRRQGKGEYLIPQKGLFRFVSSPNYLGEIVEWTGFAIATWSAAGLAFALFTIANLLPRAISNHGWYKKTFAEYPVNRRILFPYIW
jgi:3-oxo-5-alpha-steroid 4-dehydrogenase 1